MPIEVELPGGIIAEFPDGTAPEVMKAALSKRFPVETPQQAAPQGEKPMSWSDVPMEAIQNIPSSAAKFAGDIVQPFLHPIETAKGLASVGSGLVSKAKGALGVTQDPKQKEEDEAGANAVGRFFLDRYGSMEALKKTLASDPVGFAGDLSLALTGPGAVAARGPGVVGKAGQIAKTAGQTVDPLNAAVVGARTVAKAPAAVLGVTAGTGSTPVREAFNAGRTGADAFGEHMRGKAPISDVVDMAENAVGQMRKERSDAYKTGIASTKADTKALDLKPIFASLRGAYDSVVYKGIPKNAEAVKVLQDMSELTHKFRNLPNQQGRTAEALDALKQGLGDIRETTKEGTTARRIADDVYNTVKAEIVRQVPEYAKTMQDYVKASDNINEVRRTLSVNERSTTDTTLRKLQSTMRNNVNTNYGARTKLVDDLARHEPDLKPALAGQAMSDLAPRGIARVGAGMGIINAGATMSPIALAMLPMASPRVVGESAYALGKGAKVADSIASAVGGDKIRQALLYAYGIGNLTRPLGTEVP